MKHKSWFSVLFDLAIVIFLAWMTIFYATKLQDAKEIIEVTRYGFLTILGIVALCGTIIIQRLDEIVNKD